jgi:hypothetical protein
MRRTLLLLASASMMSFAVAAHATTMGPGTYNLENAKVAGYSVTGTITLDSSNHATSVDLIFNDPAYSSLPIAFNTISSTNAYNGLGQDYITAPNNGGQIGLYFSTSSDSNGNFDLCLVNGPCGTGGSWGYSSLQTYGYCTAGCATYVQGFGPYLFSGGYLSAATTGKPSAIAQTPEPSSLMLLGTGVLGFAGVIRRRLIKS